MLWDELIEGVVLHITPLCSLLHIPLKEGECVCRTSENCKSLVLQDKCNIEILGRFLNSFLTSGNLSCLLIAFANSLDPDQGRHNLFDALIVFLKEFSEKINFEKSQQTLIKAWKITQHAKS